MTFEEQHRVYLAGCEEALEKAVEDLWVPGSVVGESAQYSLLNRGKRVRGILVLAVCDLLGGNWKSAVAFAAAIEMIHAFSLIHDDLPCMDDDDMRRGKPANHIVYGEATALLAGDLLSLEAFEVAVRAPLPPKDLVAGVKLLSSAAGARGMIYGQELDLEYETKIADSDMLHKIHRNKTGALISGAVGLGIVAAGYALEDSPEMIQYAENIGLVFQIVDDILDVTASAEVLGKPIGSDKQQGKTTFVSLFGLEQARAEVERLTTQAVSTLQTKYGEKSSFLLEFAKQLTERVS